MPWTAETPSEILAVHGALMPTGPEGEVLIFGGDEHNAAAVADGFRKTRLFDVASEALVGGSDFPSPDTDVFCSGHAFVADGRLLIAGGTSGWGGSVDYHDHELGFPGHRACWYYNPSDRSWFPAPSMQPQPELAEIDRGGGRWYPGVAPLPDGELIAFAGHPVAGDFRHRNLTPERFNPWANTWTLLASELANSDKDPGGWYDLNGEPTSYQHLPPAQQILVDDGAPIAPPYLFYIPSLMYPRAFAVPGRRFFFATPQPIEALTEDYYDYGKEDGPRRSALLNLQTSAFEGAGYQLSGNYNGWDYPCVLLPILPGDDPEVHILQLGASAGDFRINLDADAPAWRPTAARSPGDRRVHSDAVILPTGQVCLINGVSTVGREDSSRTEDVNEQIDEVGVRYAEIYDPGITWNASDGTGSYGATSDGEPSGDSWAQDPGTAVQNRNYHSIALLLPNGKVFTAGGNTRARSGNPDTEVPLLSGGTKPIGIKSIELFEPWYLADPSLQPQLTNAPIFTTYDRSFTLSTPQAASIQRVALIRCGSATHNFNPDQRYIGLAIEGRSASTLTVRAPKDGWAAPPGHYMLWIVDDQGRPCRLARFLRLGHVACNFYQVRDSMSREELETYPASQLTIEEGLNLYFTGFRDAELTGAPTVSIFDETNNTPLSSAAFSVIPRARLREIEPGQPGYGDLTQKITYTFDLRFNGSSLFGSEERVLLIGFQHHGLSCETRFALKTQPTPYTIDIEPGGENPHWLSTDLRVFKILEGQNTVAGVSQGSSPIAYLNGVLDVLNDPDIDGDSLFQTLQDEQDRSKLSLKQTERVNNVERAVFNYAIAKVRYRAQSTPATRVRVFFRMCPALTTSLAYDENSVYRRYDDGAKVIPLLGIEGQATASIPFFGVERIETADDDARNITGVALTEQPEDERNTRTIEAAPGEEATMYFGCWLDINRPEEKRFVSNPGANRDGPWGGGAESILQMVRNVHQCLVAEVYFAPDATIPNASPGQSDNLAQRNIAFESSDNPGGPATHTVATTLEVRRSLIKAFPDPLSVVHAHPSGVLSDASLNKEYEPDELVFRWNGLPRDSVATMFFSSVTADEILEMARLRLSSSVLEKVDDHTLRLRVGDVSYLPVPYLSHERMPALLSVQLPSNVVYGQEFVVDVHQYSGTSRLVNGSFQLRIPVRKAEQLLEAESERLSILRYIAQGIPQTDRWYPIFRRYLGLIADRVEGFGGDPTTIHPHPNGEGIPYIPPAKTAPELCREAHLLTLVLALSLSLAGLATSAALLATALVIGLALAVAVLAWWARACCGRVRCAASDAAAFGGAIALLALGLAMAAGGGGAYAAPVMALAALIVVLSLALGYLWRCRGGSCCDGPEADCEPRPSRPRTREPEPVKPRPSIADHTGRRP